MADIEREKTGPDQPTDIDAILAGNMPIPSRVQGPPEKKPSNVINKPANPEPAPKRAMDAVEEAAGKLHELGEQGLKKGKELVDSGTKIINTKALEGMDKWKEWSKQHPKAAAALTAVGAVALAIGAYKLLQKLWRGTKRVGRWMWKHKWKILTLGGASVGAYLLGRGKKAAPGGVPPNAPVTNNAPVPPPAAPHLHVADPTTAPRGGRLLPPNGPKVT